jgi:hypothetical protein
MQVQFSSVELDIRWRPGTAIGCGTSRAVPSRVLQLQAVVFSHTHWAIGYWISARWTPSMCSVATCIDDMFRLGSTLSGLATRPLAPSLRYGHSTSLHLPQPVVFKVPVRSSRTPITPDCGGSATSCHCLVCTSPYARIAAVRLSVCPLSPLADLSATLLTGSQSGAPSQPLAALAVLWL